MQPKRAKEKEGKRERALKVLNILFTPTRFCYNFSWNRDALFHFHSLPAAVAFVCVCGDTATPPDFSCVEFRGIYFDVVISVYGN